MSTNSVKQNINQKLTQEQKMSIDGILEISKAEHIPLPNLLSGFFLENILERFMTEDWNQTLCLKNTFNLGLEFYREQVQDCLEFYLVSDKITFDIEEKAERILTKSEDDSYSFSWSVVKEEVTTIDITASWDRYHIPVKVKITELLTSEIYPVEKILDSGFYKKKKLPYLEFPVEIQLAENVIEIFENLELINTMEVYDMVYRILTLNSIEGRKIYQFFIDYFIDDDIDPWRKKWNIIVGYKSYGYMKKKWKSYTKKFKKEMVSWEEIILMMEGFFTPIWNAIENDVIFFGDWMPNLKRFLD